MGWWQRYKIRFSGVLTIVVAIAALLEWFWLYYAWEVSTAAAISVRLEVAKTWSIIACVGWICCTFSRTQSDEMPRCTKPKCGYNLTGNTSGCCPECGTPCGKGVGHDQVTS